MVLTDRRYDDSTATVRLAALFEQRVVQISRNVEHELETATLPNRGIQSHPLDQRTITQLSRGLIPLGKRYRVFAIPYRPEKRVNAPSGSPLLQASHKIS